jgi:hypothetical protein
MSVAVAVFHTEQPDGQYQATCPTWPDWTHRAPNLPQSRVLVESSLMAHITRNTRLSHYVIPHANEPLRID